MFHHDSIKAWLKRCWCFLFHKRVHRYFADSGLRGEYEACEQCKMIYND